MKNELGIVSALALSLAVAGSAFAGAAVPQQKKTENEAAERKMSARKHENEAAEKKMAARKHARTKHRTARYAKSRKSKMTRTAAMKSRTKESRATAKK